MDERVLARFKEGGAGDPATDEAGVDAVDLADDDVDAAVDDVEEASEFLLRFPRIMMD